MLCPHCQANNADDSRFCGVCGKATSSTEPASDPSLGEAPALIGRVIAGRYRILAKLGEGGMGAVFRAEQISLKRTVAIKLLRPDLSANAMLLRRFNAEAEAVAKLRHPNTVNIYDFGQDTDGTLFIAMELIEGHSLRHVVHHEAPLPLRRALSIASQVAASLADAHAKTIIHRDLKPDNVMLTDRGRSKDNVTVLDFGIAKLRDDTRGTQQMTQAGDMLGTPQYMAPEQIRAESIDGRTDIYALGCMLYEMLTGRLPFEAPTVMALLSKHLLEQAPPPSQRRPDLGIPPAIDDLVMTAMAKDPGARSGTMEEYGERIAALLAALPPEPTAQRSAVVGAQTPPAYSAAPGGFAPPTPPPPGPPTPPPPGGASSPTPPPSMGYPQQPGYTPPPYPSAPPPPYPEAPPPYPGPPAAYPPGYPPQPSGAPPPYPTPFTPAPSGSSKLMWIIVAVLLCGAAGAGVYFATRGKDARKVDAGIAHEAPEKPDPEEPDPEKPDPEKPDPWNRIPDAAVRTPDPTDDPDGDKDDGDKDDPDSATANVPGKLVDIGQGVKLIAPPGYPVKREDGNTIIGDPMKLAILGGPITEKTNDTDALARTYAAAAGLQVINSETQQIAGKMRKVYLMGGTVQGVQIVHIGVPLLGPGYRIAVIIHMLVSTGQPYQEMMVTAADVLSRRIIVPGGKP